MEKGRSSAADVGLTVSNSTKQVAADCEKAPSLTSSASSSISPRSQNVSHFHYPPKRQIYCDCLLFTPTVAICSLAIALFRLSLILDHFDSSLVKCDDWNLFNSKNIKSKNVMCNAYRNNINDTNDAWRLCNMFINVARLHDNYNSSWNWFDNLYNTNNGIYYHNQNNSSSHTIYSSDTIDDYSGYNSNYNYVSLVCNWTGITCNSNETNILRIHFDYHQFFCSEINMSYIPLNIKELHFSTAAFRFDWDPETYPSSIEILNLDGNDIYGNMNNMSKFTSLKRINIRGNVNLNNIDLKSLANTGTIFWGDESQKCDPVSYCLDENFHVTDRTVSYCGAGQGDRCLETCGYCTPQDLIGVDYAWQPRMNDLTTMFIVLIGCLVCTISTIIGVVYHWKRKWHVFAKGDYDRRIYSYNYGPSINTVDNFNVNNVNNHGDNDGDDDGVENGNYHVLINHVGFGPMIACVGILLLLVCYLGSVIESDRYLIGIATFCAGSLSTGGWGTMEYGFFDIEKKLGLLKYVIIDKKYKQVIANHDRMGKLYWYYKPKSSINKNRSRQSKYVIFIKTGSNKCLKTKIFHPCCYARECNYNCKYCKYNKCSFTIKIIGPSYMEWRLLFGILFAPVFAYIPLMWYYARRHNSWGPWYVLPIDTQILADWDIKPNDRNITWAFAIIYIILFIIPSLFSKLALIQGYVFTIAFIIVNLFEAQLFALPYYDSAGISITGPKSVTPIFIWLCIIWGMLQLVFSFRFSSKIQMRRLSSVVIAKFLSIFDIITDTMVLYSWLTRGNYIWAIIQLVILFLSQLFLTMKTNELHSRQLERLYNKYHQNSQKLNAPKLRLSLSPTIMLDYQTKSSIDVYNMKLRSLKRRQMFEKIITLLGMGRLWFAAKVWVEYDNHEHYQRVKLWEILLESFPSVALMYYVTLSQESAYTASVLASIIISFINICVANAKTTSEYITQLKKDKSKQFTSAINIFQLPSATQMRQNQQNHRNKFEIELEEIEEIEKTAKAEEKQKTEQNSKQDIKSPDHGHDEITIIESNDDNDNGTNFKYPKERDRNNSDTININTSHNYKSESYIDSIPTTNLQLQQRYSLSMSTSSMYGHGIHGHSLHGHGSSTPSLSPINSVNSNYNIGRPSLGNIHSHSHSYSKTNVKSIDNLIVVDKTTGEVKFRFEKEYDINTNKISHKSIFHKQLYKTKIFMLNKKENIFETIIIAFVLVFVLSDFFMRISPPIVLFITLNNLVINANNGVIVNSVIASVIGLLLACLILFVNYYIYRDKKLIMIISGFFTNWYYFSCAIGIDYFDTMIEWNDFNKEHISRIILSTIVIVIVVIISFAKDEWEFDMIIIGFLVMIVINLAQLHILQRIPRLNG